MLIAIAMNRIFLFIIILFSVFHLSGQDSIDTIKITKQNGNLKFYKGNQECTFLELSKFVQSNPEAYKFYKQAKLNRNFSGAIFGIGFITTCYGLLFGIAEGIEKEESSLVWSGLIAGVVVGGGVMALSIPIGKAYKQNITKAIDYYNTGILHSKVNHTLLRAGINENGITLQIRF